jgi:hypothetical protein
MKFSTVFAIVLFILIAVGHLLRLMFRWDIAIAGYSVPMWPSVAAFIIAFLAAALLWSDGRR